MPEERQNQNADRRAAKRVDTQMEGTLAGGAGEIKCRISNLSRLGACALSNTALPEMTRVKVRFGIEDGDSGVRWIACEAAVVRSQKRPDGLFEIGLFFTTMQSEDRAAIERFANRSSPALTR